MADPPNIATALGGKVHAGRLARNPWTLAAPAVAFPLCATTARSRSRYLYAIPTDEPVTCSRCLGMLAKRAGR